MAKKNAKSTTPTKAKATKKPKEAAVSSRVSKHDAKGRLVHFEKTEEGITVYKERTSYKKTFTTKENTEAIAYFDFLTACTQN